VNEELSALQLPAGYLQAALAASLQHQQLAQQQELALLPSPGCSCFVDVQLIDVGIEQHPMGQQYGCVGCVNKFSNVIPSLAELQAHQDGSFR
jgi:hypothetical protein